MVNITWFSVSNGFITYTVGNFAINSENNVEYRIPSDLKVKTDIITRITAAISGVRVARFRGFMWLDSGGSCGSIPGVRVARFQGFVWLDL